MISERQQEANRRNAAKSHGPTTPEGRAACMNAGMDDYLTKPFTREALHATLARWLAAAPTAAAAAPVAGPTPDPAAELLLDQATLAALRRPPAIMKQRTAQPLRTCRAMIRQLSSSLSSWRRC